MLAITFTAVAAGFDVGLEDALQALRIMTLQV
jgi:hypothetical protein